MIFTESVRERAAAALLGGGVGSSPPPALLRGRRSPSPARGWRAVPLLAADREAARLSPRPGPPAPGGKPAAEEGPCAGARRRAPRGAVLGGVCQGGTEGGVEQPPAVPAFRGAPPPSPLTGTFRRDPRPRPAAGRGQLSAALLPGPRPGSAE